MVHCGASRRAVSAIVLITVGWSSAHGVCRMDFEQLVIEQAQSFAFERNLGAAAVSDSRLRSPFSDAGRLANFVESYPEYIAEVSKASRSVHGPLSPAEALTIVDRVFAKGRGGQGIRDWPAHRPLFIREAIAVAISSLANSNRTPLGITQNLSDAIFSRYADLEPEAAASFDAQSQQAAEDYIDTAKAYTRLHTAEVPQPFAPPSRLRTHADFTEWLADLHNGKAVHAIEERLKKIETTGEEGKSKLLLGREYSGTGLREIKVDASPGYRLYYKKYGSLTVIFTADEKPKEGHPENYTAARRAKLLAQEYEQSIPTPVGTGS